MAELITFRDTARDRSPRWLQHGFAEKLIYAIAIHFDALGDAVVAGVRKRFPGFDGGEDALALIGRDRLIRRGPAEAAATYIARLLRWLVDHRTRGGPYALLAQVGAYYAAAPFAIALAYETGARFARNATTGAVSRGLSGIWDPDTTHWARWWLIYDWPTAVSDDGLWSDPGVWDDGVWDADLTQEAVADLRTVPSEWNAAHCRGHVVLRGPGIALWDDPLELWSDPGVWDSDGAGTVTIAVD